MGIDHSKEHRATHQKIDLLDINTCGQKCIQNELKYVHNRLDNIEQKLKNIPTANYIEKLDKIHKKLENLPELTYNESLDKILNNQINIFGYLYNDISPTQVKPGDWVSNRGNKIEPTTNTPFYR